MVVVVFVTVVMVVRMSVGTILHGVCVGYVEDALERMEIEGIAAL